MLCSKDCSHPSRVSRFSPLAECSIFNGVSRARRRRAAPNLVYRAITFHETCHEGTGHGWEKLEAATKCFDDLTRQWPTPRQSKQRILTVARKGLVDAPGKRGKRVLSPWGSRVSPYDWRFLKTNRCGSGFVASRVTCSTLVYENHVYSNSSVETPRLLTLNEAARRLSICRRSLERLIAAQQFPRPFKVGPKLRSSRVPESDVAAYLAKRQAAREEGPS